jgi:hypothetical protein
MKNLLFIDRAPERISIKTACSPLDWGKSGRLHMGRGGQTALRIAQKKPGDLCHRAYRLKQ